MLYLIGLSVGILGWHIITEILHRKEREKLLNRIMTKNYAEFEYYDKKYKGDLKEIEKIREEDRELTEKEVTEKKDFSPEEKKWIRGLEEEWGEEQIDTEKLKEIIGQSNELEKKDI